MIIVTTDEVAGYQIVEVLGETMGAIAYSSYGLGAGGMYGSATPATISDIVHGCRNEAMNRLWTEASSRGANAVVGMRYDLSQLAEYLLEACAYGTAVVLRPLGEGEAGATPQSIRQAIETNGQPASPSQPPPSDRRPPANLVQGTLPPHQQAGHQAPRPPHPQAPLTQPGPQGQPPGTWQQPPSPGFR
ncbi:YbjQ family protein [Microlunatus speluncae]|uniref:YbjQ family protein n=1 Tax=Microlunatus speluncae TaxID=2594267 RepID=UPI0012662AB6|nr:heavy metal-binding domain-containing protein [Microlunatus speluncae]